MEEERATLIFSTKIHLILFKHLLKMRLSKKGFFFVKLNFKIFLNNFRNKFSKQFIVKQKRNMTLHFVKLIYVFNIG